MSNKLLKAYPGEPAQHDIVLVRGDTYSDSYVGYDKDGQPYDFTGHTFRMQVRTSRDDNGEVVIDIPNDDFHITLNHEGLAVDKNNVFKITHHKDNTDVSPGSYVYDIEMTDAANNTQTIIKEENYFKIKADSTR